MSFSARLIKWYDANKRTLPWRGETNPYYIWLSEVILQQTRVDQGMAYYHKFVKNYPTIQKLARAGEDQVLKDWQGLGYYSRARNLHTTAKIIASQYKGVFPDKYENILGLKGIGTYTAAAIASFAFNQPYPVVDGNVYRVLSRVYGVSTPIDSGKGKKEFYELANLVMDKKNPAVYNQAIMEFGALHCTPANPLCEDCPLNHICFAFKQKKVKAYPVKSKKIIERKRYFEYFVIHHRDGFYIKKRTGNDIWKNLYDFPLIEMLGPENEKKVIRSVSFKNIFANGITIKKISSIYKHILTHQTIYARFWEIQLKQKKELKNFDDWIFTSKDEIEKYAIPKLIDNFSKEAKLF